MHRIWQVTLYVMLLLVNVTPLRCNVAMLQCCCYCCYNVSNNSCSSPIFWPISAYNQPKSIPPDQTYFIFSLFLYSLLLVNVTLLWCEYCNATVTISCCHYAQMLYVCVIVWDVAFSKYHQKLLLHWVPMLPQYTTGLSMHFHMLQNDFIAAAW